MQLCICTSKASQNTDKNLHLQINVLLSAGVPTVSNVTQSLAWVAFRHRGVAARRTHVAVGRRGAVAVKFTAVVRPVRPWAPQPYYGAVFDGVTLGAVIAATAVPTSPSIDLCWYWSNSSQTRGYWDFCQ